MNRAIVGIILCGLVAFVPKPAGAKILPMDDAMAVSDAVHAHVANSDELDLHLVGEGSYAVAFWKAEKGHGGGAALLKKTNGNWQLIEIVPQVFSDPSALDKLGVPPAQATALIADLQRAKA
jgi:hypothetical protein